MKIGGAATFSGPVSAAQASKPGECVVLGADSKIPAGFVQGGGYVPLLISWGTWPPVVMSGNGTLPLTIRNFNGEQISFTIDHFYVNMTTGAGLLTSNVISVSGTVSANGSVSVDIACPRGNQPEGRLLLLRLTDATNSIVSAHTWYYSKSDISV